MPHFMVFTNDISRKNTKLHSTFMNEPGKSYEKVMKHANRKQEFFLYREQSAFFIISSYKSAHSQGNSSLSVFSVTPYISSSLSLSLYNNRHVWKERSFFFPPRTRQNPYWWNSLYDTILWGNGWDFWEGQMTTINWASWRDVYSRFKSL